MATMIFFFFLSTVAVAADEAPAIDLEWVRVWPSSDASRAGAPGGGPDVIRGVHRGA